MKSMTGYGYREEAGEKRTLSVELKSYNNRYLDVYVNLPAYLGPLEPRTREFLSSRVSRGKLECNIRIRELEEEISIHLDKAAAAAYADALRELRDTAGLPGELTLDQLLRMDGILKVQKNRDTETYWEEILPLLEASFREYEEARIREGGITAGDIRDCLDVLERWCGFFLARSGDMEAEIKANIRERFYALLEEQYDENRVLAETAMLLMKYSISEEIVRLKGHIESFRRDMDVPGAAGKKLDFLCQEMGREINTIGSKSTMADVIQGVVECKDRLERIREQLRNLE